MGLLDIFKKKPTEKKLPKKCSECFCPINGYVRSLDDKKYCQECYNRKMTIIQQTGGRSPEKHDFYNSSCVTNQEDSEYEIILPKTLFKLYDISTDLPGDNVSQSWANVIIDKCERLCIEKNSITYSAHSIGHNTGRCTTYEPISFEQLENIIKQSDDSTATKYSGMSQINWKEYIKEKKAKRKESKYPILTFGKYDWYILDKYEDGTILLLSKYGIDTLPWNTKEKLIDWPDSTLCHWLNTGFIKKSFTEKEKQALLTFDDNTRVSLLNRDLVEKYLKDDGALTAQPNQYALSRGAFSYTYSSGRPDCKIHVGNGLAWLKDTYKGEKISFHTWANCIYWDGSICMYSFDFDKAIVRPLIKVDSQKLRTFHC